MFRVVRVAQRFQKGIIAPYPADVLGWAGAFGLDAQWQLGFRVERKNFFKRDLMLPAVAEIVLIYEEILFFQCQNNSSRSFGNDVLSGNESYD